MKPSKLLFVLPLLAAIPMTSCVGPGYLEPGVSSVGVNYSTYDALPPNYVGDSYYYGGRYYAGGRYESGQFHDHGRAYSDRYYHNGQYYYGGRHEQHGHPGGHDPRGGSIYNYDDSVNYRSPASRPPNHAGQPFEMRRMQ